MTPHLIPLLLVAALVVLPACGPDFGPDDHGPPPVPSDLAIRQQPNDTVRVGQTVRVTAVYADSLNPKYEVGWRFHTGEGKQGRTVEWQPPLSPGEYLGEVTVTTPAAGVGAYRAFRTIVLP